MPTHTCQFVSDDLLVSHDASEPLQEQILIFLRRCILGGRLRRGSRMPSSRTLAAEHEISRTTVVQAYAKLEAEGYIVARPRIGYFVAKALPSEAPPGAKHRRRPAPSAAGSGEASRRQRNVARERGAHRESMALSSGVPAVDRFPWHQWTRLSAQVLRRHAAAAFAWADPHGEPALRQAVAEYLNTFRGVPCTPRQVLIASGSQPLVEMLIRTLGETGDEIWFEEPGDPTSRAVLQGLGLRPVPVPVDQQGLDVERAREAAPRARFALVAPSHHYPLTVTMSMQRRRALIDWAGATGAWIIENEIDGDYRFSRRAREPLYTLDDNGRVMYLGSFNKAIAPGLRIGYAVVPEDLVDSLEALSAQVSVHQQLLLAKFWSGGHLAAHMRELREMHARRRRVLLEALRRETDGRLAPDKPPEAGLRVAALLPPAIDERRVIEECLQQGIWLGRPISRCYASSEPGRGLNIGFASTPSERIRAAVRRLARIARAAETR